MENNLAVLIDFENIAAGTEKEGLGRFDVDAVMQRVVDKGRILVARSYADWGRFSRFKQSLLMANVTMFELTSHGMQDKNRADIAMVVDALDLAFTKDYLNTFVIVSGDSDFTPMVLKMRELNKRVIGIGTRRSTSRLLVQACDEFIFYDSIVKQKRQSSRRSSHNRGSGEGANRQRAFDLLVQGLEGIQRENPEAPLASVVKSAMRRKSPEFSETELGYTSFARFLEAAQEAGYVSISRDRKSGGYRVDSVEGGLALEDAADDAGRTPTEWADPYLPAGAKPIADALEEAGFGPMAYPTRLQVLQLIETCVADREGKRRRVNIQFVREDVRKRIKKTHPEMPSRAIRHIFNALMQAGLLIHKDGTAIRSASAAFRLEKTAEQLNDALLSMYLGTLKDAAVELNDTHMLADLFLGNRERTRDVETAIAWLVQSSEGYGDESALNDLDLDDLLVADDDGPLAQVVEAAPTAAADLDDLEALLVADDATAEAPAAEAAPVEEAPAAEVTPEPAPEPAPKKTRTRKKKTAAADDAPAPKKRVRRRKKAPEEPAPEAAEAAPEASAAEPEAEQVPEKRTRRRTRKKTEDPVPEAKEPADPNDLDLDALLQVDE